MRVFDENDDEESNFVYVCDPFDGAVFSSLFSSKQRSKINGRMCNAINKYRLGYLDRHASSMLQNLTR